MKEKILNLRAEGKSYNEIVNILHCSKGTIAYHCGIGQKEKTKYRRKINKQKQCKCGNVKLKTSNLCNKCKKEATRERLLNKTIEECIKNYKNNSEFTKIRSIAKLIMDESGKKKECIICGFDIHVEICHIKPIKSFPKNTLIGIVNAVDNLVYLCPNHHYMYDKNLIEL